MKIAWIGLGVMGFPMAGHLARAGHDVTVFNRTRSKADEWVHTYKGRAADSPALAASGAQIVISCVGNDDDLRAVTLGADGAFKAMQSGSTYIDCTTTSAAIAREFSAYLEDRGIHFLDAPVSGGQAGAEMGELTVMVGGCPEQFARVEPLFEAFARKVQRVGDVGSGQTAKMVNQICIAGIVQGLSEGMLLAERTGLDIVPVMEALMEGAAGSWQMSNRWKTMAAGEYGFGFAVDWMRKDLDIALAEVARVGASAPVAALVDQFYADVQRAGGGRWDTSSLLYRLR